MSRTTVSRNVLMSVIQVAVSGATLFFLYRFLLQMIGPEKVGVWTIVFAAASAARVSEMGFAGSAVKYSAKYMARGDQKRAAEIVHTTAISIGVILAGVLLIGYPVLRWFLGKFIPLGHLAEGRSLLPYALVSVWLGAVASVFLSGLDGCQRVDLRATVIMIGYGLLGGLTWILVPRLGLTGLAWAQIGQGVFMLAGSRILLQGEIPVLPIIPRGWRYRAFREMFQYGFNIQIVSIFVMLFEPTTKVLMAKFGGLGLTAYYEMANRMVNQFRALIIAANQALIPRIAALYENNPEEIRFIYSESYRIIVFLSLPLYALVAAGSPLASLLWIGHSEKAFIGFSVLLAMGLGLNTLMGPAYFVNLGTGILRWNTRAHVAIGLLNVVFGYSLGLMLGGIGVVLGYVMALGIGSILVVYGYHREERLPYANLLPRESWLLLGVSCAILILGIMAAAGIGPAGILGLRSAVLAVSVSLAALGPVVWKHPLRRRIFEMVHRGYQPLSG